VVEADGQQPAEGQAQRRADEENQRPGELEAICDPAQAEAAQRAEKQRSINTEIDTLRQAEAGQLEPLREAEVQLQDQQWATYEPETNALQPIVEANSPERGIEVAPEIEPVDAPWLVIDLHQEQGSATRKGSEFVTGETSADLALFEPSDFAIPSVADVSKSQNTNGDELMLEPMDGESSFAAELAGQLGSKDSAERAAALADLAHQGGDESFRLITKSFEDPVAEVRNATARALYDLDANRAATFTRALREASPDRRRKIGAAIAGSGLARDAINSLSGESREKTHNAFSILFLMAKAGEVLPLMQAIKEHSDMEVRLAVIKLLALSNQPQSLPGLRSLVVRGSLPPDVHGAVMAAIYSLSNAARENAPAVG